MTERNDSVASQPFEPIAIIGRGCVLPGSLDVQALWQTIEGRHCRITAATPDDWQIDPARVLGGTPGRYRADHAWSDRGGFVRGFADRFDPAATRLDPAWVARLDPLLQWSLAAARQALDGLDAAALAGPRGGVVLGNLGYPGRGLGRLAEAFWLRRLLGERVPGSTTDPHDRFGSGLPAMLVARAFGLTGGALALDAACASGLYAIKVACDRLQSGQTDFMLAGGVNGADPLFLQVGFSALNALSHSGRSLPLQQQADGLVPAEGAAFVALRRLTDAQRDGDPILGVIHGLGVSNDGRSGGFLSPAEAGQVRSMKLALAQSGWRPADLQYVECHATGTQVGDAVELASLQQVYGDQPLALGALKASLGHTITTSGVAGVLKLLGALEHDLLPGMPVAGPLSPALARTRFRVPVEHEPWSPSAGPRRAAVSSFGFGGNNAHLLLEAPPEPGAARFSRPPPAAAIDLAIVGIGVRTQLDACADSLARRLLAGEAPATAGFDPDTLGLPARELAFPPNELKQALGQQLLLLQVLRDATRDVPLPDPERTGIFVGAQVDAAICRHTLRMRWAERIDEHAPGLDPELAARLLDALSPPLDSASVLGNMPNVPANRLSNQLDLRGQGFVVAREELSGDAALELARMAIQRGELDCALVAAVDLSREPVHQQALARVLPGHARPPADAAVMLQVKSLAQAQQDGDPILAVIHGDAPDGPRAATLGNSLADSPVLSGLGHAHAASGLLHLALATLALQRRVLPGTGDPAVPLLSGPKPVHLRVDNASLAGERCQWWLGPGNDAARRPLQPAQQQLYRYAAESRSALQQRLQDDARGGDGNCRLAIVATPQTLPARRQQALAALASGASMAPLARRGIHFREQPLAGELAFAYTGAAAAYPGMGRELLLNQPALADGLSDRLVDARQALGWALAPGGEAARITPFRELAGCAYLCQLHTEYTRRVLGLQPDAVLGLSSGETNAMFAFGIWQDMDGLLAEIDASGLYTRALAGRFQAVRQHWGLAADAPLDWTSLRVRAEAEQVRAAVAEHEQVYLTIINSPNDCVISGSAAACDGLLQALGRPPAAPVPHELAVHCPVVTPFAETWQRLHDRPTRTLERPRFYSSHFAGPYRPDRETVTRALTGQALETVNFPVVVERAWQDGVRIFVEHGPRDSLAGAIGEILGEREHLVVSLDRAGVSGDEQLLQATAALWCAGVAINLKAVPDACAGEPSAEAGSGFETGASAQPQSPGASAPAPVISFRLHPAVIDEGLLPAEAPAPLEHWQPPAVNVGPAEARLLQPAPALPRQSPLPLEPAAGAVAGPGGTRAAAGTAAPASEQTGSQAVPDSAAATMATAAAKPASGQSAAGSVHGVAPTGLESAPTGSAAPPVAAEPVAGAPAAGSPAAGPPAALLLQGHRQMLEAHQTFLQAQSEGMQGYQQTLQRMQQTLLGGQPSVSHPGVRSNASAATPAKVAVGASRQAASARQPTDHSPEVTPRQSQAQVLPDAARSTADSALQAGSDAHRAAPPQRPGVQPGTRFDRTQLETLASGSIASVLGDSFAYLDALPLQVRMPAPPLLLADRVLGIEGEPHAMGLGRIWTETDVRADSWYLHHGRMPAGIFIECGQADLLLISWLGIDAHNRGERAYRLLGCELVYHGDLPQPGETLHYEICIDGHARQGDVRLFFFHYDCWIDGELRISMRNGQAGFFSRRELDEAAGVLWSPEQAEYRDAPGLAESPQVSARRSFTAAQLQAWLQDDLAGCFGPEFGWGRTHVRTPRPPAGAQGLLQEVTAFDPTGGPAGRGYLRVETSVAPDDWFFAGHFRNDPCMPGTLMADACLQAMAFHMAAHGWTLARDGWRFQPVQDTAYRFWCRGQVTPESRRIVYELFVDEQYLDEGCPTLFAHVLCTVDGRKAFLCERMGLQLVPDWPLSSMPDYEAELAAAARADARPLAHVDGFPLDARALIHAAWGPPTRAFGAHFAHFEGPRRSPRLPGPPYHFVTRITELTGPMQRMQAGARVTALYDIPEDAWYFRQGGRQVMPTSVLMEVVLQPCGWLATYTLDPGLADQDLVFRNLDGQAVQHLEVTPAHRTLATTTELVSVSRAGGLIIDKFVLRCWVDDQLLLEAETVFGFFPPATMASQKGFATTDVDRQRLAQASDTRIELCERPAPLFGRGDGLTLATGQLLMLDRISGYWPTGGSQGLGAIRAVRDIDPGDWFFRAHFFQDPVQPGSLGIEAMLQSIQTFMLLGDLASGLTHPQFEPLDLSSELVWHYRGQVTPASSRVTIEFDVTAIDRAADSVRVTGMARLWVDGLQIYQAPQIGMRIVAGPGPDSGTRNVAARDVRSTPPAASGSSAVQHVPWKLDLARPEDAWLADHRPSFTLPALPFTQSLELMANAACRVCADQYLQQLEQGSALRWITLPEGRAAGQVRVNISDPERVRTALLVEAEDGTLQVAAQAVLRFGPELPDLQQLPPLPPRQQVEPLADPYADGSLFHGPALQLMQQLWRGPDGARARLDLSDCDIVPGVLHPALLDAALHCLPHDGFSLWSSAVAPDQAAFPARIDALWVDPALRQAREVDVEARWLGLVGGRPRCQVRLLDGERVLADYQLTEYLLPKGRLGHHPGVPRRQFLQQRQFVPGIGVARTGAEQSLLQRQDVVASDLVPGTVAHAYQLPAECPDPAAEILRRDHAGQLLRLHPSVVRIDAEGHCRNTPLNPFRVALQADGDQLLASGQPGTLDMEAVGQAWVARFQDPEDPLLALGLGLVQQFARRVVLVDPDDFHQRREQPALYLANHQTGVESLLFLMLMVTLTGVPAGAIAKREHQDSWLGQVFQLADRAMGARNPMFMLFFERSRQADLLRLLREFASQTAATPRSLLVHVDGTRALQAGAPVVAVSSVLVDLAVAQGLPIVPVRFAGGLGPDPVAAGLEFPWQLGQQDYFVGRAITPEVLEAMPYAERAGHVRAAINGLGPQGADDVPLAADSELAAQVAAARRAGLSELASVLRAVLAGQVTSADADVVAARLLQALQQD